MRHAYINTYVLNINSTFVTGLMQGHLHTLWMFHFKQG